jgi:transcriptional regulator with XRE-family HTH domain
MRKNETAFDFSELGQAIKEARNKKDMTRDEAAALIPIDPRYLTNIENKGKNPSLQVFYKLVTLFELSVDQFFYPSTTPNRSTLRRQLDNLLDNLDDKDLIILEATTSGIIKSKEAKEV